MDRLVPCFEPGERLLIVASPNVRGHDPWRAALGADGRPKGFSAIGAVGEDFAGIIRENFSACLAVMDVGRGNGHFLHECGLNICAHMCLEAVDRWLPLVFDPSGFVITLARRADDGGVDDGTRLHAYCLGPQL